MENTSENKCIVCGSTENSLYLNCTDYFVTRENFQLLCCKNCGFIYTVKAPQPENIGRYYKSEDYISHSDTQKGLVNKLYHLVRNIMLGKKWKLIRSLSSGLNLLDIGCGTGYFLNYMKNKGYTCEGIELDDKARNFAIEHFGLSVNSPDNILKQPSESKFDVITLWHVLEHLHNADNYISRIKSSLNDNGVLIIALPNCSSFDAHYYKQYWAAYDVPRHLWHFNPENLEKFLNQSGFRLEKIKRMPFDAYYNSMLSAKYANKSLSNLNGVVIGFLSNFRSFFNSRKSSSVIYILKKLH